jgi:hypothetical protein
MRVKEHHSVFTPVLSARGDDQALTPPRVKRVGDLDGYRRLMRRMTGSC